MTENSRSTQFANDSLTVGHIERTLTTAHLQQQIQKPATVQSQGPGVQPSAANSSATSQTNTRK